MVVRDLDSPPELRAELPGGLPLELGTGLVGERHEQHTCRREELPRNPACKPDGETGLAGSGWRNDDEVTTASQAHGIVVAIGAKQRHDAIESSVPAAQPPAIQASMARIARSNGSGTLPSA